MYSREELFLRSIELFLCLFPSLLRNSGNKHKNNPLVSAETVRHSSTYIILYIFILQVEMDKTFGFINQKSAMQYERLKQEFLAKYPNRPANAKLEEVRVEGSA